MAMFQWTMLVFVRMAVPGRQPTMRNVMVVVVTMSMSVLELIVTVMMTMTIGEEQDDNGDHQQCRSDLQQADRLAQKHGRKQEPPEGCR